MYAASAVTERWIERQQNEQPKKSIFTSSLSYENRAKEISIITTIIDLYEISLQLNPKIVWQRSDLHYFMRMWRCIKRR